MMNKYPIYIPSKSRYFQCSISKLLEQSGLSYSIVVEPQDYGKYCEIYNPNNVLQMDKNDQGIAYARTWIKKHSIKNNEKKHWQMDDNIRSFKRWNKHERQETSARVAICSVERFSGRFKNCGIVGLRSSVWGFQKEAPYKINKMVYCCTLDDNSMDIYWRVKGLGSDTDYSIQVCETRKWCTVLMHKYQIDKPAMGKQKGGNELDYADNGIEKRIASLQSIWGKEMIKRTIRNGKPMLNCNHIWRTYKHSLIPINQQSTNLVLA